MQFWERPVEDQVYMTAFSESKNEVESIEAFYMELERNKK